MIFKELEFTLKDGRRAVLRSPTEKDAEEALEYFTKVTGETDFLLFSAEEAQNTTIEVERNVLKDKVTNPCAAMISCFVEGKFVGNCDISFDTKTKIRHRMTVGIAILKEYWNLGIGTKMFEAMESMARKNEYITQMELFFIEGNERALHLYEKVGFRIVGIHPNAIRLRDGTLRNEYLMIKEI